MEFEQGVNLLFFWGGGDPPPTPAGAAEEEIFLPGEGGDSLFSTCRNAKRSEIENCTPRERDFCR